MHFKLILAFVEDKTTNKIMKAARKAGATGATVINNARGEGVERNKTFFGMSLESQRDVLMFLVEEHLCKKILERISAVGQFDERPGSGIAIQIDVEDAVGVKHQMDQIVEVVGDEL